MSCGCGSENGNCGCESKDNSDIQWANQDTLILPITSKPTLIMAQQYTTAQSVFSGASDKAGWFPQLQPSTQNGSTPIQGHSATYEGGGGAAPLRCVCDGPNLCYLPGGCCPIVEQHLGIAEATALRSLSGADCPHDFGQNPCVAGWRVKLACSIRHALKCSEPREPCPAVQIGMIQLCKSDTSITVCSHSGGEPRCYRIQTPGYVLDSPTGTPLLENARWTLMPGELKPLWMVDCPHWGLLGGLPQQLGGYSRIRIHDDTHFQTYVVARCAACALSKGDCRAWTILSVIGWAMTIRAEVRDWRAKCKNITCDDWKVHLSLGVEEAPRFYPACNASLFLGDICYAPRCVDYAELRKHWRDKVPCSADDLPSSYEARFELPERQQPFGIAGVPGVNKPFIAEVLGPHVDWPYINGNNDIARYVIQY